MDQANADLVSYSILLARVISIENMDRLRDSGHSGLGGHGNGQNRVETTRE